MVAADRGQTSTEKASGSGCTAARPATSGECNVRKDDAANGETKETKGQPGCRPRGIGDIDGREKSGQYGRSALRLGSGIAWAFGNRAFLKTGKSCAPRPRVNCEYPRASNVMEHLVHRCTEALYRSERTASCLLSPSRFRLCQMTCPSGSLSMTPAPEGEYRAVWVKRVPFSTSARTSTVKSCSFHPNRGHVHDKCRASPTDLSS
ncbi:hypothetical protein V1289_005276 [Bradyrhizobium sp. AZCC 2289]